MADTQNGDRSAESRQILDRVAREAHSGGLFGTIMQRARGHLGAADTDQSDWAEVWGTRIGRTIGAVALCALIFWVLSMLVAGA